MNPISRMTAVALAAAALTGNALAVDVAGFDVTGYSRGGPVFTYNKDTGVKGGLSLGGDLQKYRLGNEGDNGVEVNIARTVDMSGAKVKFDYMPVKWGSDNIATDQAFVEVSGLAVDPGAGFWIGQRRNRINDVHIVDHFLMDYGNKHLGAGVNGLSVGGAKLGLAMHSAASFDSALPVGVNASRLNAHLSEIKTNEGGKAQLLLTVVSGSGLGATRNSGSSLGLSHDQSDFVVKGLNNTFWLQTSQGHASLDGNFLNIKTPVAGDTSTAGAKGNRIADSLNWQMGAWGGQALVGYQTSRSDMDHLETKDFTLGGRVSYAVSQNFKLLVDAGTTTRKVEGQADQRLNKVTFAPALALSQDFWSRPELRFYVTRGNWNTAAALANAATFGKNGKTSQTLVGVQYEIWW